MKIENIVINSGFLSGGVVQNGSQAQSAPKERESRGTGYVYDLGISYASEQEAYVRRVVKILEEEQVKVFFAPNAEEKYKGRDMYVEFYKIFRYQCRLVACFLSEEYRKKEYTMHEFQAALLRKEDCIIPIYFDRVGMKGLDKDINYLKAGPMEETLLAGQILARLTQG